MTNATIQLVQKMDLKYKEVGVESDVPAQKNKLSLITSKTKNMISITMILGHNKVFKLNKIHCILKSGKIRISWSNNEDSNMLNTRLIELNDNELDFSDCSWEVRQNILLIQLKRKNISAKIG